MSDTMQPGLILNVPEDHYHAGLGLSEPTLSYSGAKLLLDCPARYRHQMAHRVEKAEFDFGHVAHRLITGSGVTPYIVDAPDWRTKAAQQARKDARAEGKAPILRDDYRKALAMRNMVRAHPIASRLFTGGDAEVTAVARDPETKVVLRSRFDYLTRLRGRPVIVDYKTVARSADPATFGRAAYDYGYDVQDSWYRHVGSLAGLDDPAFLFVIQEKTAPYLVSVVELTDDARQIGAERGRYARRLFVDCMTRDQWPGYPPVVHPVALPGYATAPFIEGDAA